MRVTSLPNRVMFGYGSVDLGLTAVEVLVQIYLLKFYTTVVGLEPGLAGMALSLAVVWDAVTDPVMGTLSDNTVSRWGRRRPFFIPGAIALAAAFVAVFNPPSLMGDAAAFAYLLGTYLLVNTTTTIVSVPHLSLGGELCPDRHVRTKVMAARRVFGTIGLIIGTVLPAAILEALGGDGSADAMRVSRSVTSFVIAPILVITAIVCFRATRGYDTHGDADERERRVDQAFLVRLFRRQRDALANPFFGPLVAAFVIAGLARTLNASIALAFYEFRLDLPEQDVAVKILLPFFLSFLACIPIWVWISRRYGKKRPAFAGVTGLGVLTMVAYPLLPRGEVMGPIFVAVVGGFFSSAILLFDSMVADTVDYDELKTRQNREGLYFGVWKLVTKLSRALGLLASGTLLSWIGFEAGVAQQTPEVEWRLALVFGPVVGACFLVAALVFLFVPLTDERHERIQALLRRRKAMGYPRRP